MKTKIISIPSGCKRVDVDHENGVVVMHIEDEYVQFKRGDIISIITDSGNITVILANDFKCQVFGEYKSFAILGKSTKIYINDIFGFQKNDEFRHATPTEAQLLFDKLESEGYKWNAETLELEKIVQFEKGELVLCRDNHDNIWIPAIYDMKDDELTYCFRVNKEWHREEGYKQCTKYTPELMGTKNKPK